MKSNLSELGINNTNSLSIIEYLGWIMNPSINPLKHDMTENDPVQWALIKP
jgi:hypothetical protein